MTRAETRRLQALESSLRHLASQLASTGFICSGSVLQRSWACGKPGCRCQADPPQLHGPYWQWTRTVAGKTVTRRVDQAHARRYQQWIANRRRVSELLAAMEEISQQADELLPTPPPQAALDDHQPEPIAARPARRRVGRPLAEMLIRLPELVEPVAEAAQVWLDAKDDGDRELLAEARENLEAAFAESDLIAPITQLARLVSSRPPSL